MLPIHIISTKNSSLYCVDIPVIPDNVIGIAIKQYRLVDNAWIFATATDRIILGFDKATSWNSDGYLLANSQPEQNQDIFPYYYGLSDFFCYLRILDIKASYVS